MSDIQEADSATQRAFLLSHTDLTEADLSDAALEAVDREITRGRAVADQQAEQESLSAGEVARLLGLSEQSVMGLGDLYVIDTRHGRRFPRWQFARNRSLPSLGAVIHALPDNYHPLEVEEFMTEPSDELSGMTPVEWLAEDGQPDPVVTLADARAWE